jgi:Trypsin-like peptidase domain
LHALLFAILLKAATVIVSGDAVATHPQDLVLVGVGTGVAIARIDAHHYAVATAAHVARYANARVAIYGHPHAHSNVESVVIDPHEDLAILIVSSAVPIPVVPLTQQKPRAGAMLEVVGHPYAQTWRVTYARYAQGLHRPSRALQPLVTAHSTVWICRGCDRGNSGSGIFDGNGRLEGIIYAAAPLPPYRRADQLERAKDAYNPSIVREMLAIDVSKVRSLLTYAQQSWRNKGQARAAR